MTVDVCEEPMKDVLLVICHASEQIVVSVFCELGMSGFTSGVQPQPNALMDSYVNWCLHEKVFVL